MSVSKKQNNGKPLVSVIIAVKDGESFIEKALISILNQTYSPLEILVVDGGSKDKTRKIVEKFDKVKTINQPGIGISNAYNTGILNAQGEYISFLSADDYWMPDKISRQISALQANPSLSFAVCFAEFFLNDPKYFPTGFRTELLETPKVAYIMETLCARRSVFNTVGFFNEKMRSAEDVDWFARALDLQLESIVIEEVMLRKRIHNNNLHLEEQQNSHYLLNAVKNSFVRKRKALNVNGEKV